MNALALREKGSLELLSDLERAGALKPTSLILDPDTSYERWEALGSMLGLLHRSAAWTLGDWVEHGERVYGEKYSQAVEATGLAPQTLMNYASVCRSVPPERRRASLPFSSHALVAKLKPREQDRWLKRAEKEGWTRQELKQAMGDDLPPAGDLRSLAQAVWVASRLNGDSYVVPREPMQAMGAAL